MRKIILFFICLPLMLMSQEEVKTNLYISVNMTAKAGQGEALEAAVLAHNKQFHGEGLYRARLFHNINGPSGGTYTWVMGPTNYTALDNRPGKGAHDDDWDKVSEYVESFGVPSYWTYDAKLSHNVADSKNSKRLMWMYDIKSGQGKRWAELVEKVKKVYEEKRPDENLWVVWNDFANTKAGMDAVVIFPFDKWAWMDRKSSFAMQYEEVFGPGSWHHFLNEFNETVNGRVDWLRRIVE